MSTTVQPLTMDQTVEKCSLSDKLGTFVRCNYKNSTLTKSPHLQKERIESYDDYDEQFQQQFNTLKMTSAAQIASLLFMLFNTESDRRVFYEMILNI